MKLINILNSRYSFESAIYQMPASLYIFHIEFKSLTTEKQ